MPRFLTAVLLLTSLPALAQAPLASQPLLFSNDQVKVYSLGLRGDDTVVLAAPDHGFFMIALQDSVISVTREGEAPIIETTLQRGDGRFLGATTPLSIISRKDVFQAVVLEFMSPYVSTYAYQYRKKGWTWGANAFPAPISERATFVNPLPLNQALAWDVQLMPGDMLPAATGPGWLLVAVSDIELKSDPSTAAGSSPQETSVLGNTMKLQAGAVRWFPAGPRPKLVNKAKATARFVIMNFGREIDMPPVPTVVW